MNYDCVPIGCTGVNGRDSCDCELCSDWCVGSGDQDDPRVKCFIYHSTHSHSGGKAFPYIQYYGPYYHSSRTVAFECCSSTKLLIIEG